MSQILHLSVIIMFYIYLKDNFDTDGTVVFEERH